MFLRVLLLLIVSLLCACGSGSDDGQPDLLTSSARGTGHPGQLQLPAPTALPRTASASSLRLAADFLPGANRAVASGSSADFTPDFAAGSAFDTLAYAIYSFDLTGFSGPAPLLLSWETAPADSELYLAYSNFASGGWSFQPQGGTGQFSIDTDSTAVSDSGLFFVAVILTGSADARLSFLRAGDNLPPLAVLESDLSSGAAPLEVSFSAELSSDSDGSIVLYEFDPEGDGSFVDNGTDPAFTHSYTSAGRYEATVRVTDNEGASSLAVLPVGLGWQHTWGGAGFEQINDIAIAADGSICLVGIQNSFSGADDALVACYSQEGELLWDKSWGGNSGDEAHVAALNSAGDLFVAGLSTSFDAEEELFVLKFRVSDGALLVQKLWGGDFVVPGVTDLLPEGDSIRVYGTAVNPLAGHNFGFTALISPEGTFSSQQSLFSDFEILTGAAALDDQGELYVSGAIRDDTGEQPQMDGFVARISGGQPWTKRWPLAEDEVIFGLNCDDPQMYACGVSSEDSELSTALLLSMATDGTARWARLWKAGSLDGLREVIVGGDGTVLCAGQSSGTSDFFDGLLLSFNTDGSLLSEEILGGADAHDIFTSMALHPNGGLAICGSMVNASVEWSSISGVVTELPTVTSDLSIVIADLSEAETAVEGALEEIDNPVLDSGGGGRDGFIGLKAD